MDTIGDCSFLGFHIFSVHLKCAIGQAALNLTTHEWKHPKGGKLGTEEMMAYTIECAAVQKAHFDVLNIIPSKVTMLSNRQLMLQAIKNRLLEGFLQVTTDEPFLRSHR